MLDVNRVLAEYRIIKVHRRVYNGGALVEQTTQTAGDLGVVAISARELVVPGGKYPIIRFAGSIGGMDMTIKVEDQPDDLECLFLLSGQGRAILVAGTRGTIVEYTLDDRARRPLPPISTDDFAALVVEPNEPPVMGSLPEYQVRLTPVAPGEHAVAPVYPDNLGLRTKLGGEPDYIQEQETPLCQGCGAAMTFVAQVDSLDHVAKQTVGRPTAEASGPIGGAPWMFQDVGMIYVFYCFRCGESLSFVQSY